MKHLVIQLAILSSLVLPMEAIAGGTRTIPVSEARGLNGRTVELPISPGYDLTIGFLESDEIIVDVSLGDYSSFAFSGLVGNLCPKFAQVQCQGNGARLLKIKQIKPIKFENMTSSADGSTTLTFVTQDSQGEFVYTFILRKGEGRPEFTHLNIAPDRPWPMPNLSDKKLTPEEIEQSRLRLEELYCRHQQAQEQINVNAVVKEKCTRLE